MVNVSPERFEELVDDALDSVPTELAALVHNLVVLVEDEPPEGEPDADPITTLRQRTRWPVPDAAVEPEKPVTDSELRLLRELDPQGVYR